MVVDPGHGLGGDAQACRAGRILDAEGPRAGPAELSLPPAASP
jgi:hypothetical protein